MMVPNGLSLSMALPVRGAHDPLRFIPGVFLELPGAYSIGNQAQAANHDDRFCWKLKQAPVLISCACQPRLLSAGTRMTMWSLCRSRLESPELGVCTFDQDVPTLALGLARLGPMLMGVGIWAVKIRYFVL